MCAPIAQGLPQGNFPQSSACFSHPHSLLMLLPGLASPLHSPPRPSKPSSRATFSKASPGSSFTPPLLHIISPRATSINRTLTASRVRESFMKDLPPSRHQLPLCLFPTRLRFSLNGNTGKYFSQPNAWQPLEPRQTCPAAVGQARLVPAPRRREQLRSSGPQVKQLTRGNSALHTCSSQRTEKE